MLAVRTESRNKVGSEHASPWKQRKYEPFVQVACRGTSRTKAQVFKTQAGARHADAETYPFGKQLRDTQALQHHTHGLKVQSIT